MAGITEDASTPAIVSASGNSPASITTAAFSPPAGSLLVALVTGGYGTASVSCSITDSNSGTWTQAGQGSGQVGTYYGLAAVYYQYLAAGATNMTVTASYTNLSGGRFLAVRVLTGAAPAQNSATKGGTVVTGTQNLTVTINTTMGNSYIYGAVNDVTNNDTLTAANSGVTIVGQFNDPVPDAISSAAVRTAGATTTPGAVTFGVNDSSHGGQIAYMEIQPATKSVPTLRTWTTGEVVTAAEVNSNVQTPVNFLLAPPRTVITSTSGLTVATGGTPTLINTWNSAIFDSDGMWTGGNALTCFTPGRYRLTLYVHYPYSSTAGEYHVGINYNGSGTWGSSGTRLAEDTRTGSVTSVLGTSAEITIDQYLNAGDYVTFYTAQTTGASLTVPGNLFSLQASARWIASA